MTNPHPWQPTHRANGALSRRDVLRGGLGLAAMSAGVLLGASSASAAPAASVAAGRSRTSDAVTGLAIRPFLPYTSDSYFRTPVAGLSADPNRTTQFRTFMRTHPDQRSFAYPRINGTGTNRWGTAYAMGTAGDPVWKLTGAVPAICATLKTTGFHAPEWLGSVLTGTTDSPFCVVDVGSGFT